MIDPSNAPLADPSNPPEPTAPVGSTDPAPVVELPPPVDPPPAPDYTPDAPAGEYTPKHMPAPIVEAINRLIETRIIRLKVELGLLAPHDAVTQLQALADE